MDTVVKALAQGKLAKDAGKYLAQFKRTQAPCFAVVKVGGDVVEHELQTLVETCATLYELGLMPVVIHGGGPQMNDELKRQGVEPRYIKGSRVTDEPTLKVAQRIFTELNLRVVRAFEAVGVPATPFASGIFGAEIRQPEMGFVGEVTGVVSEPLLAALNKRSIPVLTSLGMSSAGQVLNVNADVAARDLVLALKPQRVLFASAKGGWVDDLTGEIVSVVDLANEYEGLASLDYTGRQGTLLKLNEIKQILDGVPDSSAVAITSAGNMIRELFTRDGAGSLFRKGAPVQSSDGAYWYGASREASPCVAVVASRSKLGGKLPPVLESFTRKTPEDGPSHEEELVWRALKRDHPSLAWTWQGSSGSKANKANVLAGPGSQRHADVVLNATGGGHVAFFNQGHELTGWTADTARRLLGSERKQDSQSSRLAGAPAARPGSKVLKVGLLGARGYVGREFVQLLCGNPNMELVLASSRALKGQRVVDCFDLKAGRGVSSDLAFAPVEASDLANHPVAKQVDIWVLALPNGLAPPFVEPLKALNPNAVLIDLGADFRFSPDWAYGLPERHGARDAIKKATKIANPGCYATGAQAAIMPVAQPRQGSPLRLAAGTVPTVFGVSGYSGAGTTPSDKNDPRVLQDNLLPYSLVNHMHERECSRHLGRQIAFMPHVASWFQGIHLTTTMYLDMSQPLPTIEAVLDEYRNYYKDQVLVQVSKEAPTVRENMCNHDVRVGGFTLDPKTGRLVVVSTIDNLLKGAASQCMQNLNLACGLDEYQGIPLPTKAK